MVTEKRKELTEIQIFVLNSLNNISLIEKEMLLSHELTDLMIAEESYFKQKSRINWIKKEDQNTIFFSKNGSYQSK